MNRCSFQVLGRKASLEDERFYNAGAQAIHLTAITSSSNYANGFIYNKDNWLLLHTVSLCDSYSKLNTTKFLKRVERLRNMPKNSRGYIWGSPFYDDSSKVWRVIVAKPITDKHGRKLLLGFTIALNKFVKDHAELSDNAFYIVMTDDGKILPMF